MRVAQRGRFHTLTLSDGTTPVRAELYGCTVVSESTNGRNAFLTLDLSNATARSDAGIDVLRRVDARIRREANPRFSPLRQDADGNRVIAKVDDGNLRFETWDGAFAVPFEFRIGMRVDAVLRLGAFGTFGYCWLMERVKPHEPTP